MTTKYPVLFKLVLFSFLVSLGHVVDAKPHPFKKPMPFNHYDKNKDGFISKKEFNKVRNEWMLKHPKPAHKRKKIEPLNFELMDVNNDGRLSEHELVTGIERHQKSIQPIIKKHHINKPHKPMKGPKGFGPPPKHRPMRW